MIYIFTALICHEKAVWRKLKILFSQSTEFYKICEIFCSVNKTAGTVITSTAHNIVANFVLPYHRLPYCVLSSSWVSLLEQ